MYFWPGYMEEGMNDDALKMAGCAMGKLANIPLTCLEEGEDKEYQKVMQQFHCF